MSECDSTAASAKDGSPTELPESSLPLISIIPLAEDIQFDMGSVEHVSASASEGKPRPCLLQGKGNQQHAFPYL